MNAYTVAPASARAWQVAAGSRLRITDIEGGQTGDVFAVAADDHDDGQSSGYTFDYNSSFRLTTGSTIYSRRSRPLLRIIEDEVGVHDMLYGPCSQEMYELSRGTTGPHPNCRQNLADALAAFGVTATTITTAFNIFMNVAVAADGSLKILPSVAVAGQSLTFRAERDLVVAVSACPAASANRGAPRSLLVEATPSQDPSVMR